MNYVRLGIAIAIAVLTLACAFLFNAWQDERAAFAEFRGGVDAVGQAQEQRTRDRIALDKSRKETADAQYAAAVAGWKSAADRLRESRAGSSYVPAAAPGAVRPDLACFDRAELERAIGRLDEGVSGIVAQGDEARLKLDTAIRWAGSQ